MKYQVWVGAAGIERISMMIDKKYFHSPDVIIATNSDDLNLDALKFYEALLKDNIKTEMIYSGSLNKKLKRANKVSAKYVIIIGKNELLKQSVILKI